MAKYVFFRLAKQKQTFITKKYKGKMPTIQAIWANRRGNPRDLTRQSYSSKCKWLIVRIEKCPVILYFLFHAFIPGLSYVFSLFSFFLLFLTINSSSVFISMWYILYANLRACSHLLAWARISYIAACVHCKYQTQTMRPVWHTHKRQFNDINYKFHYRLWCRIFPLSIYIRSRYGSPIGSEYKIETAHSQNHK